MPLTQPALFTALKHFDIGKPSDALKFTERLAQENGWSVAYAQRCVFEYKRFLYLATSTGHAHTPSDQVDQVWHLHLSYTRSYWQNLCEQILHMPLHHEPTKGGDRESQRFIAQYQNTLVCYEQEFDQHPPSDIWPSAALRFSNNHFVRLNLHHHWKIRKPPSTLASMALFSPLLTACTPNEDENALWFWAKAAFGVYILYKVLKWISGGKGGGSGGMGCGSGCGGGCGS
ncbi:MAG: hypothetical protein K6L80_12265 [Agarilytica sp.]